jgi:aminoglycoside 2''-phosphotransferase
MMDGHIATPLEEVARRLRAGHPEIEIRSLEYLAEGDHSRAYVLNRHLVVRIPRHEEAARALAREACVLARLGPRLPVTVPLPTWVSGAEPGASFSVHVRVQGRELTPELWRSFPDAVGKRLAMDVGRFLRRVHRLDATIAGTCGLKVLDHAGRVVRLRERLQEASDSPLPGPLRAKLEGCFSAYLEAGDRWAYEPALLHGDLGPGHVLIEATIPRITGVIDWGDVVIGDPARDFIFVYEDWGRDFLELALEGYGREPKDRIRPRVHIHYLVDQLAWTLRAAREGRAKDTEHGVTALEAAVADIDLSRPSASSPAHAGSG